MSIFRVQKVKLTKSKINAFWINSFKHFIRFLFSSFLHLVLKRVLFFSGTACSTINHRQHRKKVSFSLSLCSHTHSLIPKLIESLDSFFIGEDVCSSFACGHVYQIKEIVCVCLSLNAFGVIIKIKIISSLKMFFFRTPMLFKLRPMFTHTRIYNTIGESSLTAGQETHVAREAILESPVSFKWQCINCCGHP